MKTFKRLLFTAIFCISLSACSITMPGTATSNPVGSKVGTSKGTVVLGFSFDEDASIQTAAKNGGITRISTVDVKITNVLFYLFVTYETIVTGE